MRIGSLFSGYGGLDLAVETVFDARTVWHVENDPAASRVLAHRWPDVPNHGDVTRVDWSTVEPVDILTGGFPCQDVSLAGKRAGLRPDSRSGLWATMAYAISQLRPRLVVAENVRGLLSADAHSDMEPCPWCLGDDSGEPALRALGAVLGDLADLGYDAQWCGLRAADIGGPHGRYRIFVLAVDTSSVGSGSLRTNGSEPLWRDGSRRAGEPLGDTADCGRHDARLEIGRGESAWSTGGSGVAVADAERERHEQAFGATSGETARSGPFHPVDGRRRACVAADTSRTRLQVADSVTSGLPAAQPTAHGATADAGYNGRQGRTEPNGRPIGGIPAPLGHDVDGCGHAAANANGRQSDQPEGADGPHHERTATRWPKLWVGGCGRTAADTASDGRHEGRTQSAGQFGRPDAAERSTTTDPRGGLNAYAPEGRPDQDVRDLREDLHPPQVRESTRGQVPLPITTPLLTGMREHEASSEQGREPLASPEAQAQSMRGMREDNPSPRPPQGQESREQHPEQSADAMRVLPPEAALAGGPGEPTCGCSAWGQYASAIHGWERILGRLAPEPTQVGPKGTRRLSPLAVEFMMGLPAGWVTDVPDITRNDQLRMLGNGVVPQQATAAMRKLLLAATNDGTLPSDRQGSGRRVR